MKAPSKLPTLRTHHVYDYTPPNYLRKLAVLACVLLIWLVILVAVFKLIESTTPSEEAQGDPLPAHYPTKGKGKP